MMSGRIEVHDITRLLSDLVETDRIDTLIKDGV